MERMSTLLEKIPPQNLDAEQSTLGSMMIESSALERATQILKSEDFYRPAHQEIFDALNTMSMRDEPADIITLQEELKKRGKLDDCGGTEYLMALVESVPTAANVEYYSNIVEHKSVLRKLISAGTSIIGLANEEEEDLDRLTEKAEQIVFNVAQKRVGDTLKPIQTLVSNTWDWLEKRSHDKGEVSGIPTGFTKLDQITSGLQKSDLIILAARPSMGKTALALDMGIHAALEAKVPVAIFSLEMSADQLVQRMVCTRARVNAHRLRTGYTQDDEWNRLAKASNELWEAPIYIDDSTETSAMAMRAKCRRLQAQYGLGLVIVDYLQLMQSHKKSESRQQEISEIARGLKSLAREMKVPVIALSQLSRAVEKRDDKRPMLSDLRDSGSIEAEADLVALLFRPEYYVIKDADETSSMSEMNTGTGYDNEKKNIETTEILLSKHRNGPTGTVKVGFVKEFASFQNLYEGAEDPGY